MSELGRGKYRLLRSARITPADKRPTLAHSLYVLDSWALRGEYQTPQGTTLASIVPMPTDPDRKQVARAREACRREAVRLYSYNISTP